MFREFNVKFEDVEMLGGADNLLEGTEITKVIVRGDNNEMSSLDSMLKNCNELDTIDGELDLNGVGDIDNLLEGTELVKSINLKNINNENISANNSFPHVDRINIGGELYNKKAMQNVIASKDWTFDDINYSGTVGDNIVTKEVNIVDDNKATIKDTLEQKAKGIEIIGQTYENLVDGSGEATLLDELTLESIDGNSKEFNPHIEQPVCVETIEGETYQNLIEGKGEYKLTDTYSHTWTEENNTLENMPNAIEIPEIWGNTVQGYARAVSNKDLVNHMNNLGYSNVKFELIDDDTMIETNWGYWQPENYRDTIASDNSKALQLKPNTSYSFRTSIPFFDRSAIVSTTNILLSLKDTLSGTFTTDDTGLVAIVLMTNPHNTPFNFILVEGDVVPNIPFDLNYIQSVGDLYVDESGEPILDEEGNEQYKLEIESNNTLFNEKYLKEGFKKELYNGRYVYHATGSTIDNGLFVYNKYKFKENTQYHIKYECANVNNLTWKVLQVAYTDGTANNYTTVVDNLEGKNHIITQVNKTVSKLGFTIEGRYNPLYIYADSIIISETDDNYDLIETDKTTILMPQPLRRVAGVSDRLYWDIVKKAYFIENQVIKYTYNPNDRYIGFTPSSNAVRIRVQAPNIQGKYDKNYCICHGYTTYAHYSSDIVNDANAKVMCAGQTWLTLSIGKNISGNNTNEGVIDYLKSNPFTCYYVADMPQIIETKILEKPSLETYSPTTYISTNTEIQPSQMTINNKKTNFIPLGLQANKDYTLQLDSIGKDDKPITVNLGGSEITTQPVNGTSTHHKVVIKTPSTLTSDKLELSGEGVVVNDVMLFEGGSDVIKQEVEYIEGVQNIGKLQEDGTYKIDILSMCPLAKINDFESGRLDRGVLGYTSDSTIQIKDGSIECTTLSAWRGCTSGFAKINPNTEYSLKYTIVSNGVEVIPCPHFYTKDKVYISDLYNKSTFTSPSNAEYVRIYFACGVIGSFTIKDFDFSNKSTQSILLPQPLNKIGEIKDKFYWDDNKGHYCIEQNIDENLEVLDTPNIIDLPHLNKKYSLDVYMPTTYLQCVDTIIQPSKLLLESDIVRYKPSALETNTDYTIQFECKEKSDKKVKLNLGGTEKEVDAEVGLNHVSITTPSEIDTSLYKDRLFLSGVGNKVADVIVNKGEMNQYPGYFNGVQNTGELQDDGTYRIGIKTNEGFNISIQTNNPLAKGDKLYWNKSNKRYEIDRGGSVEVPTVSGDVIDLPRLYQREDTHFSTSTGNIKPSKIKLDYNDLD